MSLDNIYIMRQTCDQLRIADAGDARSVMLLVDGDTIARWRKAESEWDKTQKDMLRRILMYEEAHGIDSE